MSVSNVRNQQVTLNTTSTSAPVPSSASSTGYNNVDTFEPSADFLSSDTPFTTAWFATIESPNTPTSEKLSSILLLPIALPMLATLDVILYPFIKLDQFKNWIGSKLS